MNVTVTTQSTAEKTFGDVPLGSAFAFGGDTYIKARGLSASDLRAVSLNTGITNAAIDQFATVNPVSALTLGE